MTMRVDGAPGPAKTEGPRARPPRRPKLIFFALSALVIAWGTFQAIRLSWVCDDAYFSFRYARNLVRGLGLVFNPGERVEGYTNFLWTLWCALGLKLGISPEAWTAFWGIACFAGTLGLLIGFTWARRARTQGPLLPVAAALMAVQPQCGDLRHQWARDLAAHPARRGGLLVAGARAARPRPRCRGGGTPRSDRAHAPGRPPVAGIGALCALAWGRPRVRTALAFSALFLALWLPWMAWRLSYYGDLFPNTYYAKSADLAWYGQGVIYLILYFMKYWVLLAGLGLMVWAALFRRARAAPEDPEAGRHRTRPATLAALFALVYMWYVARVGGDFMFARMLIPATPFLAILLEFGLERLVPQGARARAVVATAAIVAMAVTPTPVSAERWIRGIGDERDFYLQENRAAARRLGEHLRRTFSGLPIRVAFTGAQAILAYYSDVPIAIEAHAGLTDAFIAHRGLAQRGRPGHEKRAPWPYLIERRRVHFYLDSSPALSDTLAAYIPVVTVAFDTLVATTLFWDPPVMSELERRGARVGATRPRRMPIPVPRTPSAPG